MHAKWRVPFVDEPERFWRMKHCYRPMDQLWLASPWHFPKDSPILGPVLSELRCFFETRKEQYTRGGGWMLDGDVLWLRPLARCLRKLATLSTACMLSGA